MRRVGFVATAGLATLAAVASTLAIAAGPATAAISARPAVSDRVDHSSRAAVATTTRRAHPRRLIGLKGIPGGAPAAAYRRQPSLPKPAGWPFGDNAFPQTSGTGREAGGATYWSDFVYDAFGAAAVQGQGGASTVPVSALAPTQGAYSYASPKAHGDGADIFRAAVGLTRRATYWRVDWNTLVDRHIPVAEWTFDTDNTTRTGVSNWPAGAGVHSPGVDRALVVTARGAELINAVTGRVIGRFHTDVSMRARSFIVRIPRQRMPVRRTWRVRLAAGVANAAGTGFAPAAGAEPGQPAVYNVTFRSAAQEPPVYVPSGDNASGVGLARGVKYGNFWMETHQADALAHSDVSAFSLPIVWRQLAHRDRTPEPQPIGYSVRWYVTPLHLGQGIVANPSNSGTGDLRPNYLGRVQPYAVYVPTDYTPTRRFPLTWILHSLSVNYNQYGALDPSMIQQECEDRDSICATTEGFGPDGWYFDEAEEDFWNVWHALAKSFPLDPQRTVISGYSMGGFASYKLGLAYPDLFAKAMPLAGPPGCGLRAAEGAGGSASSVPSPTTTRCDKDGDTTPLIRNALWEPYILGDGAADELVPVSSVLQQVNAFLNRGYRIHFELYPGEDHLVFATQDGFSSEIAQLGHARRMVNPGTIDYSWYPSLSIRRLGIGPTGAYWVRGLSARDRRPGTLASLTATDGMRPMRRVVVVQHHSVEVPGDPTPAAVTDQSWHRKPAPARRHRLALKLTDVRRLGVDLARARLPHGRITVTADGRVMLRLLHAPSGARLLRGSRIVARAHDGRLLVRLPAGHTVLRLTGRG